MDCNLIKGNKALEFDIYRLEVEDLNDKKEIAEITGEVLSDNLFMNKDVLFVYTDNNELVQIVELNN